MSPQLTTLQKIVKTLISTGDLHVKECEMHFILILYIDCIYNMHTMYVQYWPMMSALNLKHVFNAFYF